jgi:hypothetical protein
MSEIEPILQHPAAERHYTPFEVAEIWNVSANTIRKLFANEEGVLTIGGEKRYGKAKTWSTIRIPESVLIRVHRKLSSGSK